MSMLASQPQPEGAVSAAAAAPRLPLLAWSLYPVLVPFYLMGKTPAPGFHKLESGVPQVADYYLVLVMALVLAGLPFTLARPAVPVVRALGAFACYTLFVNLCWAAALGNLSFLKASLFYPYDVLLVVTFLVLYSDHGERLLRVTIHAVAASVFLQLVLVPLAWDHSYSRQALFFNDENQLGYYCVLAATIFALGAERFALRPVYQLAFYGAIGYLTYISQCRAAFMGLGALLLVSALRSPVRLLLTLLGLGAVYALVALGSHGLGELGNRFTAPGEYDSLASRGYDRLVNHPEYLFFGAGEGAYERFRSALYPWGEIHSTLGTFFFCYGIVGLGLFACGLFFACRRDLRAGLYLVPAFVYGTAHHGGRAAFFWALVAFVCCTALHRRTGEARTG
jgi:hypothetical protein